jgi:hypothetical protein
MNTINEYCKFILLSSTLENKLLPPPEDLVDIKDLEIKIPNTPTRELNIAISEKKIKDSKTRTFTFTNQSWNCASSFCKS